MGDPLSSAGGALAVISLGITVCQSLVKYYGSWKDYEEDVNNTTLTLQRLEATFILLQSTITEQCAKGPIQNEVNLGVLACREGLGKLEARLAKVAECTTEVGFHARLKNVSRRAMYPFKSSTLAKLREICLGLRDNLSLPLQLLQLWASQNSLACMHCFC
jgi:ankyrin repeat domain-containing protein 50